MQYLPLLSDEEAAGASNEPPHSSIWLSDMLKTVLVHLGFAAESNSEPAEWLPKVHAARWYGLSSFAYSAAGGLLLLKPEPLERHMKFFPWRVVGLMVFANGFVSYLSDVDKWGQPSFWKPLDRLLATVNALLQIAVIIVAGAGGASFPIQAPVLLGTGITIGLACKQRASAAFKRGDCDAYLRWHAAWHYTLPCGAILGQLTLHQLCDYSWKGCAVRVVGA